MLMLLCHVAGEIASYEIFSGTGVGGWVGPNTATICILFFLTWMQEKNYTPASGWSFNSECERGTRWTINLQCVFILQDMSCKRVAFHEIWNQANREKVKVNASLAFVSKTSLNVNGKYRKSESEVILIWFHLLFLFGSETVWKLQLIVKLAQRGFSEEREEVGQKTGKAFEIDLD